MPDAIVADEKCADLGELGADEGFASGQIQVLESAELRTEPGKLFERQVIALIEIAPVVAMFTGQVAYRIHVYRQKRRCPSLTMAQRRQ